MNPRIPGYRIDIRQFFRGGNNRLLKLDGYRNEVRIAARRNILKRIATPVDRVILHHAYGALTLASAAHHITSALKTLQPGTRLFINILPAD